MHVLFTFSLSVCLHLFNSSHVDLFSFRPVSPDEEEAPEWEEAAHPYNSWQVGEVTASLFLMRTYSGLIC